MNDLVERLSQLSPAKRGLLARLLQQPAEAEPVAVVGMACRLPGAPNLESFWRLIIEGRNAFEEVPSTRWDVDRFYADQETPGKMTTRWGAFVDDVDRFDPAFFGIAPREASRMDPQQRLLLEVAWEAMENSLLPPDQLAGSKTGVFVGIGGTDYSKIPSQFEDYYQQIDAHVGTGNALSIAANRLSYIFNFRGPSLAVDTACSSGLIATHLAIQSLRRGESDAAIAGGVNLILSPETTIAFSKARMLSPDGVCRPFDAAANGYVRGEGCGLLLLKRLDDARRDGDPVLAVLRGSAANQDGRTSGITAPNGESQKVLIRAALADAGLSLSEVSYIEAHGTGTPLGDPIEVQALADLFRRDNAEEPVCRFASVKGNIGHTETVSGIAGLIKTVLMLQRGVLAPQANLTAINPHIDLAGARLEVVKEACPWEPLQGSRVAGVSSFGFGGANVHVLVEEAQAVASPPAKPARRRHLVTLSARTPEALTESCGRLADAVEDSPGVDLADLAAASGCGRSAFNHRAAVVASNQEELGASLRAAAAGERSARVAIAQAEGAKRPKIAFLFTGQGSQQPGMGRGLYESEPVFREALDECDALLRPHLDTPLLDVLYGDERYAERLNETAYTQPALFAVQHALTKLWQSWGVEPDLVLGHSIGEYAAASSTGVMSTEDALRMVATRGELIQRLPRKGRMASLAVEGERVEQALSAYGGRVAIAALNGPASTVISGEGEAVERLLEEFAADGVAGKMLNVSHAFHSPLMDPMLEEFHEVAIQTPYGKPRSSFVSTLLASRIDDGELNAGYWRRHVRDTVRFEAGVRRLLEEQPRAIVEIGPAPQLLSMARRFAGDEPVAWLPTLRPGADDQAALLKCAGELFTLGANIDQHALHGGRPSTPVALPNYPFQRTRLWIETEGRRERSASAGRGPEIHPLIGREIPAAGHTRIYETTLGAQKPAYLDDHRVQGSPVAPAAAYLEQALALGRNHLAGEPFEVRELTIDEALFLPETGQRLVQTQLSEAMGGIGLAVYSGQDDDQEAMRWTRHASAELAPTESERPARIDLAPLLDGCFDHQSGESFYGLMDERGLSYGPAFRALAEVRRGDAHAVAEVSPPEVIAQTATDNLLHPALGDACIQMVAAVVPLEPEGGYCPSTYMPTRIDRFVLHGDAARAHNIYARRVSPDSSDPRPEFVVADLLLLDREGEVLAEFRGVRVMRVDRREAGDAETIEPSAYRIEWTPAPMSPTLDGSLGPTGAKGEWLLFADESGIAPALAQELTARGGSCQVLPPRDPEAIAAAISAAGDGLRGVIDLAAIDAPAEGSAGVLCRNCLSTVKSLARHASAPGSTLTVVTRLGQPVLEEIEPVNPAASAVWGFGRVASNEHPELACRLIDLPAKASPGESAMAVLFELLSGGDDREVALREGGRYVPRFRRDELLLKADSRERVAPPSDSPHRIELQTPGSFDGLVSRPLRRTAPGPGQVEVAVGATGLNFSDVLKALGLYPGIKDELVPIGIECSGVVSAVGEGVERFAVGDEVMGVAPYSFASHAVTSETTLARKPAGLTDSEAATLPVAFLTAHHALVRLAHLEAGERVLIHAGAGGVGLAAIQIAQHVGAEVFATAGSDEKRDFLRSLGVERLYDSRSLDFAEAIRRDTRREGVDVVLNSLPGDAIRESLRLLRAYGRFLEIGKTDIYADRSLGLSPFQDNLSYFAIDLDRMLRQRGGYVRKLFDEVVELFEAGVLRPLPSTAFPFVETREAFRYMAQRKNIGKVVVTKSEGAPAAAEAPADDPYSGAWLVTGGLGALGLRVAEWLAGRGARRIGLLSRRAPSEDAQATIDRLQANGAEVMALRGDVNELGSLQRAIEELQGDDLPLTGVVHAAGVLNDAVIYEMTPEQMEQTMAPKSAGAWNLHLATQQAPLREFVLFSSIACQLGSPGQANYAAGNAFLDGLAHWRRSQGLPACSINWGPWAEAGMAAEGGREAGLALRGMHTLEPHAALASLEQAIGAGVPQVSVLTPVWKDLLAGATVIPPILTDLAREIEDRDGAPSGIDEALRSELLGLEGEQRSVRLRDFFVEELAKIMGLSEAEVDPSQPLNTLGLDSLMAIELKNNVETRLGVVLPMARFMEGPSVDDLSKQVSELLTGESATAAPPAPVALGSEDQAPLSYGQQALWFLYKLSPQSTAYNIADAVRVRGPFDRDALEQAIAGLVQRHGALRTTFHDNQGRPYQTVHPSRPTPLTVVAAEGWDETRVAQRVGAEVHRPFDLENGPLLRVLLLRLGPEEQVLVFALHHIIADFWSLVACTEEFRQLYDHHANGRDLRLPELRLGYGDFTRWQRELLESDTGQTHWEYWSEQLAGELPVLELPTDRPRPPVQTFNGSLAFRWLEPQLTARLKKLAERQGATLNMLLLAAYQVLLHRYSGQDDLVVGLPTSGRSRAEFAPLVGYFVNPVAVRADLSGDLAFEDFLEQTRQRTLGALEHQDFPLPMLVDRLHAHRDPSRSTLFQALFVMQKAQVMHEQGLTPFLMGQSGASLEMAGLTFESMTLEQWVAQFDVSLAASEADGGVSLGLQYNTDLFDAATVESMLDAYERILQHVAEDSHARVSQVSVLSAEDERRLQDWNDTQAEPLDDRPVHRRIEAQAERTPEAVALVCGRQCLTYRELNSAANRLARRLQQLGAGKASRVGLCLPRGVDLVVGMLASLKAGAAYVPLDPTYPKKRIHAILGSAGMSVIIARGASAELLVGCEPPVVVLERDAEEIAAAPANNLPVEVAPDDLFYVIFTSGSTGDPKGAGVKHRGFANLIDWYCEDLGLSSDNRSLVITSHGFDLTQKNFFAPLAVGGQLHLSATEVYDPEEIREEIAAGQITLVNCTPSNFYPLVDERNSGDYPKLQSLKQVILGGEPIDLARLRPWLSSGAGAAVMNSYGPTECSDVVTRRWITTKDLAAGQPVSIGGPIRNVQAHLLDSHLAPVPPGATGELCLSGACVGAGYVNDPRLTKEKFVRLPTGERAYRTGDLCRRREDGQIDFVGRVDHQVKIRGFRIELGDIEQALLEHPAVLEAVVVVESRKGGTPRLLGYAAAAPDAGLAASDLKAALAESLPPHMVPAVLVLLPELPKTPHGKLDRRRLPPPDEAGAAGAEFAPPQGELEELLARLWADVLHCDRVGRRDNFFDLGGDSLRTIEVIARLAAEGWRATPALLLRRQTIEELAPQLTPLEEKSVEMATGPVPLTPAQHWFFATTGDGLEFDNQSVLLEVPPGLDPELLGAAAQALGATHDSLRTRFLQTEGEWRQEVTSDSGLAFRHLHPAHPDAEREMIAATQAGFHLAEGPLGALVYLDHGPDAPGRLLLALHHLVTDPYSTRLLLEDLQTAYLQAAGGSDIVLPPVATGYVEWSHSLAETARGPETARELTFWEEMLEGASDKIPGGIGRGPNLVGTAETLSHQWDEEATRRLLDHSAEPSAVLLAALAQAVSEPLLVDVERLGRESSDPAVDASRTVGWLVSMHPLLLEAKGDAPQTLESLAALWRSVPRQGMGYGMLRYLTGEESSRRLAAAPRPGVRFNYLGSMQQARREAAEAFRPIDLGGVGQRPAEAGRNHVWELDLAVREGRLSLAWTYSKNLHTAEQMAEWATAFRAALGDLLK